MFDGLAEQLAGLHVELAAGRGYSDVARTDVSEAESRGRIERLFIGECDTDSTEVCGQFRRWWVIGPTGTQTDGPWPLTGELLGDEDWKCRVPMVWFAADGRQVQLSLNLGPRWLVYQQADLGPDGRFRPETLVETYRSVG
jgi:hypothetical protein